MKFSWDKVNEKYRIKIPFKKYYNFIGIPFNDILKNLGIKKNLHSLTFIFQVSTCHVSQNHLRQKKSGSPAIRVAPER